MNISKFVSRLQATVPLGCRKIAFGFFMLDSPEWGYGCLWYDGANHYVAMGRLCFGWVFIP